MVRTCGHATDIHAAGELHRPPKGLALQILQRKAVLGKLYRAGDLLHHR